ncbi:substrate-binding periplasmic protein [Undibacterium sp. Ji22W]|uniref:substrate-binding periplasmic protein n=1 Tax=Undibacterium sp. Ji22W TaxID=3413038 RepID=UPI003BF37343
MRYRILLSLIFASVLAPRIAQGYEEKIIRAVTHADAFPYNYQYNQQIKGLVFDIANALTSRIGYTLKAEAQPWTRALQTAKDNPSILVFSVARNPDREEFYYWIGPITNSEVWLFKLKRRNDIQLKSIDDIRTYTIGDIASSSTVTLLTQYGAKIDTAPSNVSNCRKFKNGRVDLIPSDPNGIKMFLQTCDLRIDEIEKTLHLPRDTSLYIALGKTTPKALVDQLNAEFQTMSKDGTLAQIHRQWQIQFKPLRP